MSLSIEYTVRETHRVALQENLKRKLKTQAEFDRYGAIARDAAQRIDQEKDAYRADYSKRLSTAHEVVLREQTARHLEHPKPDWAVDAPPSADRLEILARNRVQADHEQRIAAIRTDEVDQYKALRNDCQSRAAREIQARDLRQDHAKEAFATANQISPHEAQMRAQVQRRSGPSHS